METQGMADGELSADCVTDLKTKKNRLSFYCVEGEHLINAAVAIVANGQKDTIAVVDMVMVERSSLEAAGIAIADTPGNTAMTSMVDRHRDAANLDAVRLTSIAKEVRKVAPQRFTIKQIKAALQDAVSRRDIDPTKLHKNVRDELASESRE